MPRRSKDKVQCVKIKYCRHPEYSHANRFSYRHSLYYRLCNMSSLDSHIFNLPADHKYHLVLYILSYNMPIPIHSPRYLLWTLSNPLNLTIIISKRNWARVL